MFTSKPSLKEVLQGDLYFLTIGTARFEVNRPEGTSRYANHLFGGEIEHQLFAVVSHSCDIADDKVDVNQRPIPWKKLPVVLGRVREAEPGLVRSIEAGPGWDRLNEIEGGAFYDQFAYRDVPGHESERLVLNLSDLITVRRESIHPATKLAELTDEARLQLRVRAMLHFGRGDDAVHPLIEFQKLAQITRQPAPAQSITEHGGPAPAPTAAAMSRDTPESG